LIKLRLTPLDPCAANRVGGYGVGHHKQCARLRDGSVVVEVGGP
jgi:hypothetical protein